MAMAQAKPEAPRNASHGRGGAGNINAKPAGSYMTAEELETPTIKSATYTTGRGGTGNMMNNDPTNPGAARAAQDVTAPMAAAKDPKGTYHWGRGGEGNMMTIGKNEQGGKPRSRPNSKGQFDRKRPSFNNVLDKGKDMLGLGKRKEGTTKTSESAIED